MFKLNTKGMNELVRRLDRSRKNAIPLVEGAFEDTAKRFVARAKREAPKDTGFLTGQIGYEKAGSLNMEIFSSSKYAGYLEFGTKRNFKPIPGFEAEASALKNISTGTAQEAIENIMQWVKRKGIRIESASRFKSGKKAGQNRTLTIEQTAWLIWHFININGIKPQPYFFKQVAIAGTDLEKDLKLIAEEIFD